MESRGNAPGYAAGGYDTMGSTLHFGPSYMYDGYAQTHETYQNAGLADDFHTYGLYWNATRLVTYVDNTVVLDVDMSSTTFWERGGWSGLFNPWNGMGPSAPFDQKFYIVMNLAVGGTNGYFPDGQGGKVWSDGDPHASNSFWNAVNQWYPTWTQPFQIDKVSVWQLPGSGAEYTFRPMI